MTVTCIFPGCPCSGVHSVGNIDSVPPARYIVLGLTSTYNASYNWTIVDTCSIGRGLGERVWLDWAGGCGCLPTDSELKVVERVLVDVVQFSSAYLHSTTMLLTEFSFCDDDDHMTITHIIINHTHCSVEEKRRV